MGKALSLVKAEKATEPCRTWRETPMTTDIIFRGKDACGRSGWFLRLTVSGLYPRRVGPYPTKQAARAVLEEFVAEVQLEQFTNLQNVVTDHQAYIVEGVPALKSR